MAERPRFFDDLAGVAGGALSAFAGIGQEIEAMIRARIDDAIRRLELVRREELDAVNELAANARAGQEAAETKLAALEAKVAALEAATVTLAVGQPIGAAPSQATGLPMSDGANPTIG